MTRFLFVAAVAAILSTGCSSSDMRKTFPVTGTVTINGAPAEPGVLVWLHPQFSENDKYPIHPQGQTTADGSFKITTYNTGDGAPEGEYVVTVEWPVRSPMSAHYGPDMFGGLFANVDANKSKPEFKANVTKQGAQLTLNLTLTPQQKTALETAKKKAASANQGGFNLTGE
jgi:hypothetical protein